MTVAHDGLVAAGRPATPHELSRIEFARSDIGAANLTAREVLVAWAGTICERFAALTVDLDRVVLAPAPQPGCDALGYGWGVVLTLRRALDAGSVEAVQLPTTILPDTNPTPRWTPFLPDDP